MLFYIQYNLGHQLGSLRVQKIILKVLLQGLSSRLNDRSEKVDRCIILRFIHIVHGLLFLSVVITQQISV